MIPENLSAIGTAMAIISGNRRFSRLLAAVSTLALRKNQARVRHHLWLAASLKFLVPFSLLVSLGSHLARLNGSADSQAGFLFCDANDEPALPTGRFRAWWLLPCCDGCRVWLRSSGWRDLSRDRSVVVALAARRCSEPRRGAGFPRA